MSDAHDPDPQTRGRETPAPRPPSRRSELVRPLRPSEERPDEAVCNAVFRYQLQRHCQLICYPILPLTSMA